MEGCHFVKNRPKRIAIIGLPGSGKSTLACKLGRLWNIPVHHLDKAVFIDNKKRDEEELICMQQQVLDQDSWIIEGCSIKTLGMRFARADLILYLRFPRLVCLWRVFKRMFVKNQDLAGSGCINYVNWSLAKYIWTFKREKSSRINQLRNEYSSVPFHTFRNSQEVEEFLKILETKTL